MRIIVQLLFIAILVINGPVVYGASTADLQAQITALLEQVQALQARLQAAQSSTVSSQGKINLTFNLRRGSIDAATDGEVSKLQQFLAKDSAIYPEGLVTGYFGPLTEAAVKRWQAKNSIQAIGAAGPITREAVKQATTLAVPSFTATVATTSVPAPTSTAPTSTAATTTAPISSTPIPSSSVIELSPPLKTGYGSYYPPPQPAPTSSSIDVISAPPPPKTKSGTSSTIVLPQPQ